MKNMKVKLIQMTKDPIDVMWVAARTCYSEKSPIEMWEEINKDENKFNILNMEKHWKLVKQVISSGHASIAEHVYFTFCIEGVSRALLAQITRHRAGIVFSVQSQRYVEIKEKASKIYKLCTDIETCKVGKADKAMHELKEILDKYFIIEWADKLEQWNVTDLGVYGTILYRYLREIEEGKKPEDARAILPNATKTNITMSINLRELMHVSNLRLCSRAQLEIRKLFQAIKKEVEQHEPRLASLLVPSCEATGGICFEAKSCGRKPSIKDIKKP
jgi:thymidylate synthase (FAD)